MYIIITIITIIDLEAGNARFSFPFPPCSLWCVQMTLYSRGRIRLFALIASHYHHYAELFKDIEHIYAYYIYCRMCLRLCIFSPLFRMQIIRLCFQLAHLIFYDFDKSGSLSFHHHKIRSVIDKLLFDLSHEEFVCAVYFIMLSTLEAAHDFDNHFVHNCTWVS